MKIRWLANPCATDLRSLAAFRIGLGLLVVLDLILRARDLAAFYTDQGVLPRSDLLQLINIDFHVSLHLANGSVIFQSVLFLASAGFALMMLVGYRTTLATTITWLLLISMEVRNPFVLNAGDRLLQLLVFWGMFLPLGACWSIDALQRNSSNNTAGDSRGDAQSSPFRYASLGVLALFLQIAVMYCSSGILKAGHEDWQSGQAVMQSLSVEYIVTPLGHHLTNYPGLLQFITAATLYLEILGPLLLLSPLLPSFSRSVFVLTFWAFHLSLWLCLEIGLFPWIPMVAICAAIPSPLVDWLGLRASWLARTPRRAFALLARWLPPAAPICTHRWCFRIRDVFVAGFSLLMCILVYSQHAETKVLPRPARVAVASMRFSQNWAMFVRTRGSRGGWYVLRGELKDGTDIDLISGESPVEFKPPSLSSDRYRNLRWRKYLINLRKQKNRQLLPSLAQYFFHDWNTSHGEDRQLTRIDVYFMLRSEEDRSEISRELMHTIKDPDSPFSELDELRERCEFLLDHPLVTESLKDEIRREFPPGFFDE